MKKTVKSALRTLLPSVQNAHDHDAYARQLPTNTSVEQAAKKWFVELSQGIKDRFGNRLRSHREKLTLTPNVVADRAGIPLEELGRIERCDEFPSVATAKRLCEVLDEYRRPAAK